MEMETYITVLGLFIIELAASHHGSYSRRVGSGARGVLLFFFFCKG
jgi:hypothetical protein